MDEDQTNAVFENLSEEEKKKAHFFSKMVEDFSKTINPNVLDTINCWFSDQTHLFVQLFRAIANNCNLSSDDLFGGFKVFFEAHLRSASLNPCIIRSKEEEKSIIDLNERFNNSKSLKESIKLFNNAIKKGIAIKEDYKYAMLLLIYLDEMNTIAKSHKENNKGNEHQSCMAVALKIMCALFNFDRFQLSKTFQIDRAHQFINAALTRRKMKIERFHDFYKYLVEVENKWHPVEGKAEWGLRGSASIVYKKNDKEKEFCELFLKHFDIDIKEKRNEKLAIDKFAGVVKSFTLECYKHDGHTLNGFCRKPRREMSQTAKKNISKGMRKKNQNMDDQKENT